MHNPVLAADRMYVNNLERGFVKNLAEPDVVSDIVDLHIK